MRKNSLLFEDMKIEIHI